MVNLKKNYETNLAPKIQEALREISDNSSEIKIYLIGGIVRDLLCGKDIFDVDVTVEGDAVDYAQNLEKKGIIEIISVQKDLRTAKIAFKNGVEMDLASTRTEKYPKKGHLPIVEKTGVPLFDDVKRRDFTINTMAMSLNKDDFGMVKDFLGGLEDLKTCTLRVLHDKSFEDDPTRIVRGLKFSVRFGFELSPDTLILQEAYLNNKLNPDISYSRLKSELIQAFSVEDSKVSELFVSQKIYKLVNPNVEKFPYDTNEFISKYSPDSSWLVRLGAFLYSSPYLEAFNFTKSEKRILDSVSLLLAETVPADNFGVYSFFKNVPLEAVLIYYSITQNARVFDYLDDFRHVRPIIGGADLIALGIQPSEKFGEIFDSLMQEKLSGLLETKEEELEFIKFKIKQLKN